MRLMRLPFCVLVIATLASCSSGSDTTPAPPPGAPIVTAINRIQGSGDRSPLDDTVVTISGIVSGDFQDNDADLGSSISGFYVQERNADSDPATSEGIFVYDGGAPAVDVSVGDEVLIEGTVNEHFGETQISAATVTVIGNGTVQPIDLDLPVELEHYEGMLVRLPQTLTVASLYELERFGTVQLLAGARPHAYTNKNSPDVAGYAAHRADFARRSMLLDDGRVEQNLYPVRYLNPGTHANDSIRSGDTATGLRGNIRYARGSGSSGTEDYRLMPTVDPQFASANPRPKVVSSAATLRVVGFNTLNFFSTIDLGQDNCGPSRNAGCRGADSADELRRQLAKLATALHAIDADIVALMEIENNDGIALQMLVDRLNKVSASTYSYVDTGVVGTDVISTGFLYKSNTTHLHGRPVILDSRVDIRFDETRNRPSIAQAFTQTSNGAVISVVVNHFKSKGSSCADGGDPDRNDGQGNCNVTRTQAAIALADWIATDPSGSGDTDYLLIGDLNAFILEDPLTALRNAGLTNLLTVSLREEYWSSSFAGESGALDHALASASLLPQLSQAFVWHINSDEPSALDYNTEFGRDPALFDATLPYRTSDHDPIIVDLNLSR